ncbi:MAG: hypothetical protein ACJA12_000005 [Glaciecola sp.]|jgi:hypothetical protein
MDNRAELASGDRTLDRHRLAGDKVDANTIELFQKQGLAGKPTSISSLVLAAATVVLQMLTRCADTEARLAAFLGHLTEHPL